MMLSTQDKSKNNYYQHHYQHHYNNNNIMLQPPLMSPPPFLDAPQLLSPPQQSPICFEHECYGYYHNDNDDMISPQINNYNNYNGNNNQNNQNNQNMNNQKYLTTNKQSDQYYQQQQQYYDQQHDDNKEHIMNMDINSLINSTHNTNTNGSDGDEFEINPLFKIVPFIVGESMPLPNNKAFSIREHIFISKDCTKHLSDYIVYENWGCNECECGLLYKYLDYIFRCQLFNKQVIQIDNQYLMFHTRLQRRSDSEFLYALLIPNKKKVYTQKWRVPVGNIKRSFLSKRELIYKLRYLLRVKKNSSHQNNINHNGDYVISQILPQKTKFHESVSDFVFDDSYQIQGSLCMFFYFVSLFFVFYVSIFQRKLQFRNFQKIKYFRNF